MARRRKPLSEEDHLLWKKVTGTVDPLFKNMNVQPPLLRQQKAATPKTLTESRKSVSAQSLPIGHGSGTPHSTTTLRNHPVFTPHNSIDHKTRKKITRGRMPIDARIDLHGMTQNKAISVLRDFLYHAQRDNYRLVLVITGKGEAGKGILRQRVPDWLSSGDLANLTSGFQEAHISHGGGGALYVRIKRLKRY